MVNMRNAQDWIDYLELEGHPEGGYFKQTGASDQIVKSHTGLDVPLYTNILFLLKSDNPSNFHRIGSNEVWYFHEGHPLTVHCIQPDGRYEKVVLGRDISKGQVLQYEVPRGVIFGSSVEEGYGLVSCMVAPGFDFREFHLFERAELIEQYPQHKDIISKLTK
ncbi:uncharacterized protein PRCAT00005107001 [Priceomyces carsonii]|uniref:uncharacterized protein n=1 Tax=Priceomyces carsonii TaxID=28549 RepID=UPI002EDB32CE|nr:unnamed protein product [Priceomyces carsonii]